MSSVDNRIVEMQFENGQFEKGIRQTIKSLSDLKKELEIDKAVKSLEALEQSAKELSFSAAEKGISVIQNKISETAVLAKRFIENLTDDVYRMGKSFLKSVTIDPLSEGFSKYEQKTKAVQTIINATGKDIGTVETQLDKLMWFTDETSYSFGDMISNVGKFTSMNVPLEDAVTAMQGISTWAASAGQGTAEASRAMYNLAQALGLGKVTALDWKSISGASMSTTEFKNTAIEMAKALKVLNAEGKTAKGTLVNAENFESTLSEGWFNKDVLMKTLIEYGKYADEVYKVVEEQGVSAAEAMRMVSEEGMELGAKAFRASQEAKTFSEAIISVKDAVSSGWMETWETIFGDYEKARVLWTDFSNILWELFASGGEARNQLLETWADLGGREKLIEGVNKALRALVDIVNAVKQAFHDIIPPVSVDMLLGISDAIYAAGSALEAFVGHTVETKTKHLPTAFVETVSAIRGINEELAKGSRGSDVKKLQEALMAAGISLDRFGADGIFGPETERALAEFQAAMNIEPTGILDPKTYDALFGKSFLQIPTEISFGWQEVTTEIDHYSSSLEVVQNVIRGVASIGRLAWKAIEFIAKGIGAVGRLLLPIGSTVLLIASGIGKAITAFEEWIESTGILGDWLVWLYGRITPIQDAIWGAAQAFLNFLGFGSDLDIVGGKIQTIQGLFQKIAEGVKGSSGWKKLSETIDRIKNSVSDSISPLKEWYASIKEAFSSAFANGLDILADKIPVAISAVANALAIVLDFIFGSGSGATKVPSIFERIRDFFVSIYESLGGTEAVMGVVSKVISWLSKAKMAIADFLFGSMKDDGTRGPNIIERVREFFSNLYTSITGNDDFMDKIDSFKTTLKTFAGQALEFFKSIYAAIKEFVATDPESGETFMDRIKKGFSNIFDIGKWISQGWSKLTGWLSGLWDGVKHFVSEFLNIEISIAGIIGIPIAMISFFKLLKRYGGMFESISDFFDDVGGFLYSVRTLPKQIAKAKKSQPMALSFLEIAGAIALIAGAIYVIGKMTTDELKQGGIVIGIIGGVLVLLALVMRKVDSSQADGLRQLGKMVLKLAGSLAIIAGLLIVLSKIPVGMLVNGGGKLAGVMIALAVMIRVFNLIAGGKANVKGLFSLAKSLLLIIGAIWILAKMKWTTVLKGVGYLALILAALGVFIRIAGKAKYKGLMGLAAAVSMLALVVAGLGLLPFGQAFQGIVIFAAIVGSMAILVNQLGKMKAKSLGKTLVAFLGVIGLIAAFTIALKQIKDVDTGKVVAFAAGLSGIMLSMAALTAALSFSSGLSIAGSIIGWFAGLTAVIAGIIGIVALIDSIPGAREWIGDKLGKVAEGIGDFIGKMQAASLNSFASSMTDLSDVEVPDTEKLNAILSAAGTIDTFASGITSISALDKLGAFFRANTSNLYLFSQGLSAFGSALSSYNTSIGGMDFGEEDQENSLQSKTDKAVAIAKSISKFSEGLPETSAWDKLFSFLGSNVTNLSIFSSSLSSFASGFNDYEEGMKLINTNGLSGSTGLEEKTKKVVAIATSIRDFAASVPEESAMTKLLNFLGGKTSDLSIFSTGMADFITSFNDYEEGMKLINTGDSTALASKTEKVIEIASSIRDFANSLPDYEAYEKIIRWMRGPATKMEMFEGDVTSFGVIASMIQNVLGGDTTVSSTSVDNAISIAKTIASFAAELETNESYDNIDDFSATESKFKKIMANLYTMADQLSNFQKENADIDMDEFDKLTAGVERIQNIVSGKDKIDTSTFLDGLDSESIIEGLSMFASSVTTSMDANSANMSESIAQFNAVGSEISVAFNSGLSSGKADTSGISRMCDSALSVVKGYKESFVSSGKNLATGIAVGLNQNSSYVAAAARNVMAKALAAANAAAQINSPSKATEEMGMYLDMGLANGLMKYSTIATDSAESVTDSMLKTARGSLTSLASMISEDMDADPVIRPVVDLSNVNDGAKAIGGILGGHRTVSVATSIEKAQSAAASFTKAKANQNGSGSTSSSVDNSTSSSVNITGNNFNIRSDNDIKLLAAELGQFVRGQNRAHGATAM